MNYESAVSAGFGVDQQAVPVGSDWRRVNYALAGYGYVVPGTITEASPGNLEISAVPTAVLTITLRGG